MKQSFDDELNNSFEKLNQNLRMKSVYHEHLRKRILLESNTTVRMKRSNKKIWLSMIAAILLLLGTSPLYSTTMASLAAKILPLEIPVNKSLNTDSLYSKITEIVEEACYELSSVGTRPNPYTIELVLGKGEDNLLSMKKVLVPEIEQFLYDQGIDQYQLNITQYEGGEELSEKDREMNTLTVNVGTIIGNAFVTYGYPELREQFMYSVSGESSPHTIEIDMPDHVKEAEEIRNLIIESIAKEDLGIKDVKLRYYNAEHRSQDLRWSIIGSDIYEALAGKSIYNVTGISHKTKDGVSQVWIKTGLSEHPDNQIISDIETAIRKYLASKEIKDTIKSDHYEIQLLSKYKTNLLQVSNVSGK